MARLILKANYFFVSRITLSLLDVKIIPFRIASLIDIQQKDWGQSIQIVKELEAKKHIFYIDKCHNYVKNYRNLPK